MLEPTNFLSKASVHPVPESGLPFSTAMLPKREFWLAPLSSEPGAEVVFNPALFAAQPAKSPIVTKVIYVSIYVDSFRSSTSRTHSLGQLCGLCLCCLFLGFRRSLFNHS
jgi:hypothetical protein